MKLLSTAIYGVAAAAAMPLVAGAALYGNFTNRAVFAQTGEVTSTSALVNARCNFEKSSFVTVSYSPSRTRDAFSDSLVDSTAVAADDYTTTVELSGLSYSTKYEYRVTCTAQDGTDAGVSARVSFWTAPRPSSKKDVSFVWAADLSGQGWGRNPYLSIDSYFTKKPVKGGYVIFEVMRSLKPDFAIFQGDLIYADNLCPAQVVMPSGVGGGIWYNQPSLDVIGRDLDTFRAHWKYNHGDEHFQDFLEEVPIYVQWDDHEVLNNWYPTEIVGAPNYPNNTRDSDLAAISLKAFQEANPLMENTPIYRSQRYGSNLEVFLLDMRSYRGPNDANEDPNGNNAELGPEQQQWLKDSLLASKATWKVISNDDPLSIITGGPGDYDTYGTGDARVLGREVELADLLKFIRDKRIENVVFITSDVHFTAAITYDPRSATFKDFAGFSEFVIGPIHAGAFGPNRALGVMGLDPSFGPKYDYIRDPVTANISSVNLPPPYLQSFGHAVANADGTLSIFLRDITGEVLYSRILTPARATCDIFQLVARNEYFSSPLQNGSTIYLSRVGPYTIEFDPCSAAVTRVQFFDNGSTVRSDSRAPYEIVGSLSQGSHNIVAKVYNDNTLLKTVSLSLVVRK